MITLATQTMLAVQNAIEKDQGGAWRRMQGKVLPCMHDAYRGEEGRRGHLGASGIGGECWRKIWYGFRWATKGNFDARTLRLFNRGHLEEGRVIAAFVVAGIRVIQQDEEGKQLRFKEGHFAGSIDGVLLGVPDLPVGKACLFECKTYNDKRFTDLKKKGVVEYDPTHHAQMSVYGNKLGLDVALYVAVNKNTDELYMEIVSLSRTHALIFVDKAEKIAMSRTPPERMPNASVSWYKCKWCDYRPLCLMGQSADRNCRTCQYIEPKTDGTWYCGYHNVELDSHAQEHEAIECERYTQIVMGEME